MTGFLTPSGLEIRLSTQDEPSDGVPLITCATDWGFSCGKEALERHGKPSLPKLRSLVQQMAAYPDGPLVAFVEPPCSTRPLALVQSDHGGAFYERHHEGWVSSWIDFYYSATSIALLGIEERWQADTIQIDHPTHEPWPENASKVILEVAVNLKRAGLVEHLRTLVFNPCGTLTLDQLRAEVSALEAEAGSHRPLTVEPAPGFDDDACIKVQKTHLERLNPLPSESAQR
jgi:hypothetical protein